MVKLQIDSEYVYCVTDEMNDSLTLSPSFQALVEELDREEANTSIEEMAKIAAELDQLPGLSYCITR